MGKRSRAFEEASSWEAHRLAQQKRLARRPLAERILWLEEAQRIARAVSGAKRRKRTGRPSSTPSHA